MKHTLTLLLIAVGLQLFAQDAKMDTTSWSHVERYRSLADSIYKAHPDINWVEGINVEWELHYPQRTLKKIYMIASFEYYEAGRLEEFIGPIYLIETYREDGTIEERVEVHNIQLPVSYKKITYFNADGSIQKIKEWKINKKGKLKRI